MTALGPVATLPVSALGLHPVGVRAVVLVGQTAPAGALIRSRIFEAVLTATLAIGGAITRGFFVTLAATLGLVGVITDTLFVFTQALVATLSLSGSTRVSMLFKRLRGVLPLAGLAALRKIRLPLRFLQRGGIIRRGRHG